MSTPGVADIAVALGLALESVEGLRVFPYLPDKFSPPVALVHIDGVEYHGAFAGGDVTHTFTVFVVVGRADARSSIATLEGYMSQPGDNSPDSICGAIEADRTLGGVVSSLLVKKSGPVAPVTIDSGGVVYLSVTFEVVVHA